MANQHLPATREEKAITVRDYLFSDQTKDKLKMAIPKWLSIDRLLRVAFTAILKNPRLLDCTRESLMGAIMQCAQLGLEPILGRAYLVPYENTKKVGSQWQKVLECQFQPGYQGLVDLAERTGKIETVRAHVVYDKDEFDIEYGTSERLHHKPFLNGDRGNPIGAYTVWTRTTGAKAFTFMPIADIEKIRAKSQAYQYATRNSDNKKAQETPWIQWPGEQMKKTVIKRHSKLEPASIEYMQAVEMDDQAEYGATRGIMLPGMDPTADETTIMKEKIAGAGATSDNPEGGIEEKGAAPIGQQFANLTKMPLSKFQKLKTTGVREFVEKHKAAWSTWPEQIQGIVQAKITGRPDWGPLWDELIGVEETELDPEPETTSKDTGIRDNRVTCPSGGLNEDDEISVEWCVKSCMKFESCDVAKEKALELGIWKPNPEF
jgi:recombination protein RecT